jgi:uncharacterized membrane protein
MQLIIAAVVWIVWHVGVAGTRLRAQIVQRIGEGPFRGVFSAVSVALLIWLAHSYNIAPTIPLWRPPGWLLTLLVLAMLGAALLFVGSITTPNPTAVGGEHAPAQAEGIQRITRHPMLWSFAIWAAVHMIATGEGASLVFFGAFLITALAGMPSIDAKLARRSPQTWSALAAGTSVVPFAAVVQGQNRIVWNEIGWWRPALGLLLWGLLLYLHPIVIGVSPLPH